MMFVCAATHQHMLTAMQPINRPQPYHQSKAIGNEVQLDTHAGPM